MISLTNILLYCFISLSSGRIFGNEWWDALTFLASYIFHRTIKILPMDLKVIMSDFQGLGFQTKRIKYFSCKVSLKITRSSILFLCFQWMCDPAERVSGAQSQSDTRHTRVPDAGGRGDTWHQPGRDEHHQGGQRTLARQVNRAQDARWQHDTVFYFEVDAVPRMWRPWRLNTRPAQRGYNIRWVKKFPE